jgi:uncharacterized membrane protein YphA (DoxX/SURF4 family)
MKRASVVWLMLIQFVLAFEWLHSGWGKWAKPGFMDNIGKTLEGFATKTPYKAYGAFLNNTAVGNADLFGNSIRIGEIGVGIALALSGIILLTKKRLPSWAVAAMVIALLGGALMNLNFFLASGWSSPSTWGINMTMGFIQLILAIYYITNRRELTS